MLARWRVWMLGLSVRSGPYGGRVGIERERESRRKEKEGRGRRRRGGRGDEEQELAVGR